MTDPPDPIIETATTAHGTRLDVDHSGTMPAVLTYRPTVDPYAVTLTFHDPNDPDPNPWLISRDMLDEGATSRTYIGIADVRVRLAERNVVELLLVSPDGAAAVRLPRRDVVRFLGATFVLVPLGREGLWLDVDGELERLGLG